MPSCRVHVLRGWLAHWAGNHLRIDLDPKPGGHLLTVQKMLLLALAGALGTIARYTVAGFVHRFTGASFPWGTLAVNALGCFVVGVLWTLFEQRFVSAGVRTLVLVGFMGAFTTFSAFALETGELLRTTHYWGALQNLALQNGLGLAMLFGGMAAGRWI
jgi:CrcB protein